MKFILKLIVIVALLSSSSIMAQGTTVTPNVLNALIDAVAAADSGDVLILEANGIYPNQGSIDIVKDLTIIGLGTIAEGNLPYIKELPSASGDYASQTIRIEKTFKIYNVFFNGFKGEVENENNSRCFRVQAPIDTLIIEGCAFEQYRKRGVALNKAVEYTSITNSIFNHMWKISNLDEGRPIDLRNGDHGTVIIQNCTFINSSDRHIRHQRFGQNKAPVVDTLIIDHCTFVNGGNFRPTFSLWSMRKFQFTNNLVINPSLFGTDAVSNRKDEIPYNTGSDAVTTPGPDNVMCVFVITEVDSFNTEVIMTNNNIYTDPSVIAQYAGSSRMDAAPLYNNEFLTLIDPAQVSIEEAITFANVPPTPLSMIAEYAANLDTLSEGGRVPLEYAAEYMIYSDLDLAYGTTAASYTGAEDGRPLGDLRWYGYPPVSVDSDLSIVPEEFSLAQNYPNPFNPSTTFEFGLNKESNVKLIIYNMLGQTVKTLVNQNLSAGTHSVLWNGKNESGFKVVSGEYLYRLEAGDFVMAKKMILLK